MSTILGADGQARLARDQAEKVIAGQTAQAVFIEVAQRLIEDDSTAYAADAWRSLAEECFMAAEAFAQAAMDRAGAK